MNFKYQLKNAKFIRRLAKPYKDRQRKKEHLDYLRTEDHLRIRKYKDRYPGKRCFIIGNGPSLVAEDLDCLKDEYTFAANRIYDIFDQTSWRPDFYLAVDDDFILSNRERISKIEAQQKFLAVSTDVQKKFSAEDHIIRIFEYTDFKVNKWNDMSAHISEDVSDYFSVGYTVTFTAIQLALYMGFREIILLGVDFNYSIVRDKSGRIHREQGVKDYFSGKRYSSTVLNYTSTLYAYQAAKDYAELHDIRILNATRGGKLEVFERVDFDSLNPGRGAPTYN